MRLKFAGAAVITGALVFATAAYGNVTPIPPSDYYQYSGLRLSPSTASRCRGTTPTT